ncbi:hypothetical protein [Haematomicrobium sanguinis]|uniref:hypothetical protein n=1 Tax=Haematomicrobium sanguinis TaxID=479106 RepID=UPI000691F1D9|nr:hypothetical protein [Haematomicrobium sanguinis]
MSTDNPTPNSALWTPVLGRGVLAAIFALLPVFLTDLSPQFMGVWAGAFWVLYGFSALPILRRLAGPAVASRPAMGLLAILVCAPMLVAGAIIALTGDTVAFAIAGSISLIVSGASEAALGWLTRGAFPLARDWLITGTVTALAGVILPFVTSVGPRGLLGVSGGAMTIVAVVLILAALTFRFNSAKDVH